MRIRSQFTTKREYLNEANKRLILSTIRQRGQVSRSQISRVTQIRPGTVISFINGLIKDSIIREVGPGESTGGRKPILLEIDPEGGFTVGVQLLEHSVIGVVTNLEGVVNKEVQTKNGARRGKRALIKKAIQTVKLVMRESLVPKEKVLGIGLAIPGLVDSEEGISIYCALHPWWKKIPFKEIFEAEFGVPVYIENDTRALTLAEKWFGVAKGVDNFVYLDVGEGIALGIVLNGELYKGTGGKAGEFGHTSIDENGPLCTCGNRGCLEAISSTLAVEKEAKRLLKEGVNSTIKERVGGDIEQATYLDVIEEAKQGDKVALRVIDDVGRHLGIAISNMVNLFNPAMVIVGGRMAEAGNLILDPIAKTVKMRALSAISDEVEVTLSQLGKAAVARGAATLILQAMFQP